MMSNSYDPNVLGTRFSSPITAPTKLSWSQRASSLGGHQPSLQQRRDFDAALKRPSSDKATSVSARDTVSDNESDTISESDLRAQTLHGAIGSVVATKPGICNSHPDDPSALSLAKVSARGAVAIAADKDLAQTDAAALGSQVLSPLMGPPTLSQASDVVAGSAVNVPIDVPVKVLPDAVALQTSLEGNTKSVTEHQWQMSVPLDSRSQASLSMRLLNTDAGKWQMKLFTDSATRQKLTPHLDKLRHKLRQHSNGHLDHFSFDEDA